MKRRGTAGLLAVCLRPVRALTLLSSSIAKGRNECDRSIGHRTKPNPPIQKAVSLLGRSRHCSKRHSLAVVMCVAESESSSARRERGGEAFNGGTSALISAAIHREENGGIDLVVLRRLHVHCANEALCMRAEKRRSGKGTHSRSQQELKKESAERRIAGERLNAFSRKPDTCSDSCLWKQRREGSDEGGEERGSRGRRRRKEEDSRSRVRSSLLGAPHR